ncbi:MAG: Glu/Leu/Phe/Val dehydrogenase dimerization domain-containing protein [Simkaniaceae bacterium]|nr:Glu/Leu/Phe/Val dehydrogenase dimerization domain-containing protein [Candidatus Sacchlamyda saccharinae]
MTATLQQQIVLEEISVPGFHKVVRARDAKRGLDAIIAIHDLRLAKAALGGTRIHAYKTFDDALRDATRLARGMTFKSAASQSNWGGGKSVIIADPKIDKTDDLLIAFAEAVNLLKGEYICAEDAGCTPSDIAVIAEHTPYAVGLPSEKSSGNPSPFTAWGVFRGVQAVMQHLFGSESVEGKTVAIQGLGSVGARLAETLFWHGAKLILTDVHMDRAEGLAKQFDAKLVAPDAIYDEPCDVFAPCAMGGIINPETIERLRCRAIAGAANNQLLSEREGEELRRVGILYAPDFVINSGGLINVTEETTKDGYNPRTARNKINDIYDQLCLIFKIARENGISTQKAVMQLVEYRLEHGLGRRTDPIYMHHADLSY